MAMNLIHLDDKENCSSNVLPPTSFKNNNFEIRQIQN
jgi:hypothetical protein